MRPAGGPALEANQGAGDKNEGHSQNITSWDHAQADHLLSLARFYAENLGVVLCRLPIECGGPPTSEAMVLHASALGAVKALRWLLREEAGHAAN
ncbi:MAG: hypothetical protein BWK76_25085 [Desulfobulbaceae bacterium A2]|nr:MAG: hypothetical protein BWK76_25085 [Desulfobulbaceae bacterium A2]